jgi:hypothetical protein
MRPPFAELHTTFLMFSAPNTTPVHERSLLYASQLTGGTEEIELVSRVHAQDQNRDRRANMRGFVSFSRDEDDADEEYHL